MPIVAGEEAIWRLHRQPFGTDAERGSKVGLVEEDQGKLAPRVDADPGEESPMVEFADSSFQQAVGGGASGIRMVPQAREVVVRMCVGASCAARYAQSRDTERADR